MEPTPIQRIIEEVVTNGRGYDRDNTSTTADDLRNTQKGLDMALLNMSLSDSKFPIYDKGLFEKISEIPIKLEFRREFPSKKIDFDEPDYRDPLENLIPRPLVNPLEIDPIMDFSNLIGDEPDFEEELGDPAYRMGLNNLNESGYRELVKTTPDPIIGPMGRPITKDDTWVIQQREHKRFLQRLKGFSAQVGYYRTIFK